MYLMVKVYLLRHGETAWNHEEVFRGQTDVPLNARGRDQAAALGNALKELHLDSPLFVAGPLSRARETAELAASGVGLREIIIEEGFNDMGFGAWEGLSLEKVSRDYPRLFAAWSRQPEVVVFPGGESLGMVAARAGEALSRHTEAVGAGAVVIVSHRAVNKALLCALLGLGQQAFWQFRQDTACLNEIIISDEKPVLVRLNDTCHLGLLQRAGKDF